MLCCCFSGSQNRARRQFCFQFYTYYRMQCEKEKEKKMLYSVGCVLCKYFRAELNTSNTNAPQDESVHIKTKRRRCVRLCANEMNDLNSPRVNRQMNVWKCHQWRRIHRIDRFGGGWHWRVICVGFLVCLRIYLLRLLIIIECAGKRRYLLLLSVVVMLY